jgi:hypothetical protein
MTNYAVERYESREATHLAAEAIADTESFLMEFYRENCTVKGMIITPDPRKVA